MSWAFSESKGEDSARGVSSAIATSYAVIAAPQSSGASHLNLSSFLSGFTRVGAAGVCGREAVVRRTTSSLQTMLWSASAIVRNEYLLPGEEIKIQFYIRKIYREVPHYCSTSVEHMFWGFSHQELDP